MAEPRQRCPDCEDQGSVWTRRTFLYRAGATAAAALAPTLVVGQAQPASGPETLVQRLYESLQPDQRKVVCFDWDHIDPDRGLLRTRVAANWQITKPPVQSEFYKAEQQQLIRQIFEQIVNPEWHSRFDKQLRDDAGGFGVHQSVALFGKPGQGKFEFVLTGRHQTIRFDGNSTEHAAFGGPIFYGHAASGFNEKPDHPGNIFWPQAVAANDLFKMLDGKQQAAALVQRAPDENKVDFRRGKSFDGIPIAELSPDQKQAAQRILEKLLEPFRPADREETLACLKTQGGLDRCHLAFYAQEDLGGDRVWDIWRLEGPAFVWHFRGAPHVHVWVNVADDPSLPLNA